MTTTASPNGTFTTDPGEASRVYLRRGLSPLALPPRSKGPDYEGWQDLRLREDDLATHFPPGQPRNIGILNGAPSGNVVDVDLDVPEARAAAPHLLPPTGWRFGRPSAPGSHWGFRTDVELATAQEAYKDVDGTMLLELRGTGGQTVYPPSAHKETGEVIRWESFDEPAKVVLSDLRRAVRELAAVALLARHWPARGSRQDAFLALAGGLLRGGLAHEQVERLLRPLAVLTRDEEMSKRVGVVAATAAKIGDQKKITGWPKLAQLLGESGAEVVRRVRDWLGLTAEPAAAGRVGSVGRRKLYTPLPPFVPFPVEALPPVVSDYVAAAARSISCDPALVALPALATAAGCIGNARAIILKKGWVEPAVIWALTVAESGGHKTPAYYTAVNPLMELQLEAFDAYQELQEEYEEQLKSWQALDKDERGGKPDPPPEPPSFITNDSTIEALGELLRDAPRGLLVARDELDGWFQSFVRYKGKGGGSDRSHWLELHKAGTLRVDRVTRDRGLLLVRRACVSVAGGIQPAVLARALDREALQAGLGARFLLAMPPRRRREWTEDELPEDLAERYQTLLRDLLALDLADEKKRKPRVLGLTPAAKALWVEFFNSWAGVQFTAQGEQASAFAKIEAYASRLALVHHVVSHVAAGVRDGGPVTEASMRAAVTLARWFANEATRVYSMLHETDEQRQTRCLVEYIRDRGGAITARQLQKSNSRRYPSADDAEAALQALAGTHGDWEDRYPGRAGGRPTRVFRLHPTSDTTPDDEDDEGDPGPPPGPDTTPPPGDFPRGNGGCVGNAGCRPDEHGPARPGEPGVPAEPPNGTPDRVVSDGPSGPATAAAHAEPPSDVPAYVLVREAAGLVMVGQALDNTSLVALDTETTGLDARADRLRLLTLGCDTTDGGRVAYLVDAFAVDPSPLWETLAQKDLVLHHGAFDLPFLLRLGFEPGGAVHDTMLLAGLLTAGTGERVNLAACCRRWLGRDLDKSLQTADWSGPLTESMLRYAAEDVLVLPPLFAVLTAEAESAGLARVADIERRCLPAVAALAVRGVMLDADAWRSLAAAAGQEADRLRDDLDRQAPPRPGTLGGMAPWNWGSPAQVREALALAGCEVASTDDDALAALSHPLADLLRQYRAATKKDHTYGAGWLDHVRGDGRVYATWRQLGSRAGRMSCSDPNLQQLPRGEHRRCVTAPPGRVLVKGDYSQIELRIAARVSGDKALLAAYQRGEDLHRLTARTVLGVQEVTKQHRQLAKAVNFGLLFGMGPRAFRQYARSNYGIDMTEEEAARTRAAFFKTYPGLAAWHRKVGASGKGPIETRTLAGRRRLDVAAYTQKLNSPVQGTGADGLKLALALLWARRHDMPGAHPVLAVHDEIVLEADEATAEAAALWLKSAMVEAMTPLLAPVPVEVEVKVARTWAGD